jgi:hypothetical protein
VCVRQHLFDEHGRATRAVDDRPDAPPGAGVDDLAFEQARVTEHRRQNVVEVVRDASREHADGLERLGMAELRGQLLALSLRPLGRALPEHRQCGDAGQRRQQIQPAKRGSLGQGVYVVEARPLQRVEQPIAREAQRRQQREHQRPARAEHEPGEHRDHQQPDHQDR